MPFVVYWPGVPEPGLAGELPGWTHSPRAHDLGPDGPGPPPEDAEWHGQSLLPVLRGEADRVDDYVIVEAGEGGLKRDEFLRSIEDARWKLLRIPNEEYQRGLQQMEYELYETRNDPMETTNINCGTPRSRRADEGAAGASPSRGWRNGQPARPDAAVFAGRDRKPAVSRLHSLAETCADT